MDKYKKVINAVYDYINASDPDECKSRIDKALDFMIRLRHSYVDNDKPVSKQDVNMEILRMAESESLRVGFVPLEKS